MSWDSVHAVFKCDGCRGEVLRQHRVALMAPGDDDFRHYHESCWQTGWYTGIFRKGEWPTPEGKPAASLPRKKRDDERSEPVFDHIKGDPWDPDRDVHTDPVNAPAHYRWLPNGIEVIDITETLNFCLGNAIKYILRADHKGKPEEDLAKAAWYIQRELERRSRDNGNSGGVV